MQDVGFTNSLTVAWHTLLATFYRPTGKRNKIVMLETEFNSDIIASEAWIENYGIEKSALILAKTSDRDPNIAV